MRQSEINRAIEAAMAFFGEMRFSLPAYAFWTPSEWRAKGLEYDEIRDLGLGWDVTDFGSGDLRRVGRTIFTLRNGRPESGYLKTYAQKAMHMPEEQKSVIHYHRSKREDIHNQAGGNILIALWGLEAQGGLANAALDLSISGCRRRVGAGEPLRLEPGESLCVPPLTWHQFWAEKGGGPVLSIEVSSVCDDHRDNCFLGQGERFPAIEEDEPPRHVLCHEYDRYRSSEEAPPPRGIPPAR